MEKYWPSAMLPNADPPVAVSISPEIRLVSQVGLVSLLTVFLHYEFLILLIVIDFDIVFYVIWPKQQKMVSIEEIIAIQKKKKTAQKTVAQKQ